MRLPKKLNILLLGGGGRECAFACKIAKSERLANLYIAPGNAGTVSYGTNADISLSNFASIKQFVLTQNINLVVVGPEEPLVNGIYDFFESDSEIRYVPVVGPSAKGAKLEGSKDFAKAFMQKHNVPTAAYMTVTSANLAEGVDFLKTLKAPYVLKADGLAAGKGVLILDDVQEAISQLEEMLQGKFGAASHKVVIEEYLSGIELSVFVATDGVNYKILPSAKDYKRIGVGDTGLNTGGMGAVSPVPFADAEFMAKVEQRIVKPTIDGFKKDGITYKGFVFIGLMNIDGEPYVIEYNVRMGDPETEVVIPLIDSDIVDLFEGIVYGTLDQKELVVNPQTAVTIVCTAGGYPEDYRKGDVIEGLVGDYQSTIYHAGTTKKGENIITSGGRVLAVTSMGDTIEEAVAKSYDTISKISYEGKYFRTDIGQDLLKYTK